MTDISKNIGHERWSFAWGGIVAICNMQTHFRSLIIFCGFSLQRKAGAGSDQREEHPRKAAKTAKDMPKNMKILRGIIAVLTA